VSAFAASLALSCDSTAPGGGGSVEVTAAPIALDGVGDVVWDIAVDNGLGERVWSKRVASSRYGDGAGAAIYIGPCDASAPTTTVSLWLVGAYAERVTTVGSFASGAPGATVGELVPFESPTAAGPLQKTATCVPDSDVSVRFDVALMRPASQGFFDRAVSFGDIFCAAKLDCCLDEDDDGACDDDLTLLFDAEGTRAPTIVLGLACTAGSRAGVDTELYLDALTLDCTAPTAESFVADITLDPSGESGDQCDPGAMSSCTGVVSSVAGVDPDDYLHQLAVYHDLGPVPAAGAAGSTYHADSAGRGGGSLIGGSVGNPGRVVFVFTLRSAERVALGFAAYLPRGRAGSGGFWGASRRMRLARVSAASPCFLWIASMAALRRPVRAVASVA